MCWLRSYGLILKLLIWFHQKHISPQLCKEIFSFGPQISSGNEELRAIQIASRWWVPLIGMLKLINNFHWKILAYNLLELLNACFSFLGISKETMNQQNFKSRIVKSKKVETMSTLLKSFRDSTIRVNLSIYMMGRTLFLFLGGNLQ